MSSRSETIEALLTELQGSANIAREQRCDNNQQEYLVSKSRVQSILEQLRELYRADEIGFGKSVLRRIRDAKLFAGLITVDDLAQEAKERNRHRIMARHDSFLRERGIANNRTRDGLGHHRIAQCYACKTHLDSALDIECTTCGWIICECGACGCGFGSYGE